MKLNFLQLENFKSYYGTHRLGPFDPNFSCIIGPNGCGKSNFIDSLLFVFGFKSHKLRHLNMLNLVHKSEKFSATYCKVTLFFSTYEGELSIARTISQSGYSYYYMNGSKSSLEQIRSMMSSHGVDIRDGNFLILQGQVQRFAAYSSLELLQHIQHICGSIQFKERILELQTIIDRLIQQNNPIQKKYKMNLSQISKLKEKCINAEEWIYWKRKLFNINQLIFEHKKAQIQKSFAIDQFQIQQYKNQLKSIDQEIGNNIANTQKSINTYRAKLQSLQNQRDNQRKILNTLNIDIKKCQKQLKYKETDYTSSYNKRADLEKEMKNFITSIQKTSTLKQEIKSLNKKMTQQFTQHQLTILDAALILSLQKQKKQNYLGSSTQKLQKITQKLLKNAELINQSSQEEVKILKQQIQKHKSKTNNVHNKLQSLSNSLHQIDVKIQENNKNAAFNLSSQNLNKQIKTAIECGILSGIWGVVKEKCYVDSIYSVAFNSICSHLDFYVVNTLSNAEKLVQYVKSKKIGVISVIIMEQIQSTQLTKLMSQQFVPPQKQMQRMFDLVKVTDERFKKILYWSLRDTLLVKDINQAVRVSLGAIRRRSVTFGGHIVFQSGLMCSNIRNIQQNTQSLQQKREIIQKQYQIVQKQFLQLSHQLQSKLKLLNSKEDIIESSKQLSTSEVQQLKKQCLQISENIKQLSKEIRSIEQSLKKYRVSVEVTTRYQIINSKMQELKSKLRSYENSEQAIVDFQEKINKQKQKQQILWASYQESEMKLKSLNQILESKQKKHQTQNIQIIELNAQINTLTFDLRSLRSKLVDNQEKSSLNVKIDNIIQNIKKNKEYITKTEQKINSERQQINWFPNFELQFNFEQQLEDAGYTQKKLKRHSQLIKEGIQPDHQLISLCNKKIQNLSNIKINFQSIAIYRQQKKKLDLIETQYLHKQKQMEIAKQECRVLESQRKDMFMKGFNTISLLIPDIFTSLSNGGEAELLIIDTIDPFRHGLQIRVKPVRKQWKKVNLLSGGQKTLTSLALIFACNHIVNCPFYVMDEIDAALDVRNVGNVGEYIKKNMNSQFLVVSLRQQMYTKGKTLTLVYKINGNTKGFTVNLEDLKKVMKQRTSGKIGFFSSKQDSNQLILHHE